ncbi:hypothetical protein JL721_8872 [Aureococcus anophagefferens]|nr:hypothetical protein JL721_8872 [Aureococcus anophagefferens]
MNKVHGRIFAGHGQALQAAPQPRLAPLDAPRDAREDRRRPRGRGRGRRGRARRPPEHLEEAHAAAPSQAEAHADELRRAGAAHAADRDALAADHESALASAAELLTLEKDHDHGAALDALRARDDDHAR